MCIFLASFRPKSPLDCVPCTYWTVQMITYCLERQQQSKCALALACFSQANADNRHLTLLDAFKSSAQMVILLLLIFMILMSAVLMLIGWVWMNVCVWKRQAKREAVANVCELQMNERMQALKPNKHTPNHFMSFYFCINCRKTFFLCSLTLFAWLKMGKFSLATTPENLHVHKQMLIWTLKISLRCTT